MQTIDGSTTQNTLRYESTFWIGSHLYRIVHRFIIRLCIYTFSIEHESLRRANCSNFVFVYYLQNFECGGRSRRPTYSLFWKRLMRRRDADEYAATSFTRTKVIYLFTHTISIFKRRKQNSDWDVIAYIYVPASGESIAHNVYASALLDTPHDEYKKFIIFFFVAHFCWMPSLVAYRATPFMSLRFNCMVRAITPSNGFLISSFTQ